MKSLTEMSTTELLLADRDNGNALDALRPGVTGDAVKSCGLFRQRREIRAELNRRHDAQEAERTPV